jgi:BMFP domain-containing protein YqiC
MRARRQVLDDVAKLATSAAGVIQGAGREVETLIRQRLEQLLDRMDLVPRDEFEAVKAMASAARTETENLQQRLDALEAAIQAAKMLEKPIRAGKTGDAKSAAAKKRPAAQKRKQSVASPKKPAKSTEK